MKLALGTAQIGAHYGIANRTGKVQLEEARKIINFARETGIDTLDTAVGYGDCEKILGLLGVRDFKIVTKISKIPPSGKAAGYQIKKMVDSSLVRLKLETLYALLLHRTDIVTEENSDDLRKAIQCLKASGKISKFGVSIYDPEELERVITLVDVDIIQAPFNILDRRLETSGWLQKLHDRAIEVHTRSTFLQGLLLMPIDILPSKFSRWENVFRQIREWTEICKTDLVSLCLSAVNDYRVSRIVIGVDSAEQLRRIRELLETLKSVPLPDLEFTDLKLINPSNWRSL